MTIRTLPMLAISGLIGAASSAAYGQSSGDDAIQRAVSRAGGETRSQVVSFSDLDLSSNGGAAALANRIDSAARQVCSPEPDHLSAFEDNFDYDRCMKQATGQALGGLDNRAVTYAYKRHHASW